MKADNSAHLKATRTFQKLSVYKNLVFAHREVYGNLHWQFVWGLFFSACPHNPHSLKRWKWFPQNYPMMIHSSNYPLQSKHCFLDYGTLAHKWWERKWQLEQWILYRLDSEALPLVEAGYKRSKTSLDGERNPVSLRWYLLRASFGILYTPFEEAQSGPEAASTCGWNCHHAIFPVARAFDVWVEDGNLQWWRRRGTSQGSKPFSEPSTNYWWTLIDYPVHTLIELLGACHNMHLLINFSYPEGMEALLACFGSEGHP